MNSPTEGVSAETREQLRLQALDVLGRLESRARLNLLLLKVLIDSAQSLPPEAVGLVDLIEQDIEFMLKGLRLVTTTVPVEPSAEERAKA